MTHEALDWLVLTLAFFVLFVLIGAFDKGYVWWANRRARRFTMPDLLRRQDIPRRYRRTQEADHERFELRVQRRRRLMDSVPQ